MAKRIPVHSRERVHWTVVDDEDFDALAAVRWTLISGYAGRSRNGTTVYMHRIILGLKPGDGLVCDHINRDKFDNRRSNLRAVTHQRNMLNFGSQPGSTSKYRGVWWRADRQKWGAQARYLNGKYHIGVFASEDDAGRAVNEFWLARGCEAPNVIACEIEREAA